MKLCALFLLFIGSLRTISLPKDIDWARIEYDVNIVADVHQPIVPMFQFVPVDSGSEYSMWTQQQECIAYNSVVQGLQFVNRGFMISGSINVHQTDWNFNQWYHDENIATGRYPHSIASDGSGNGPHISCPYLISGAWGGMGAVYERGGWFSAQWDSLKDVGGGNVGTHKCIGKQLTDGNILFIGLTDDDRIIYRTWTPNLDSLLGSGTVATADYWGFDINAETAYVFYNDAALNVYYKTSTDGITWSAQQSWNLVWPNPYPSNIIGWTQAVVTDAGNPILIFDNWNGDDYNAGNYPFRSKVYVSIASGQACIEVGNTAADAKSFYPTIAAGGNYVVALFGQPRSGTGQYTFWDVYYNYSGDNGATWSTPRSLTSGITDHNNCLWQIAKRIDPVSRQFFFVFGSAIPDPLLDLYWNIQNGTPTIARWYVSHSATGITENKDRAPSKLALNIAPNPAKNYCNITFTIPVSDNIMISLYSLDGRLVKCLEKDFYLAGTYKIRINTEELVSGVYILLLKTDTRNFSSLLFIAK
mgnify:CR=1 FL=1